MTPPDAVEYGVCSRSVGLSRDSIHTLAPSAARSNAWRSSAWNATSFRLLRPLDLQRPAWAGRISVDPQESQLDLPPRIGVAISRTLQCVAFFGLECNVFSITAAS